MKIEIHNDLKGKYQSWEAKAILNHEVMNAWSIMEVEAYGATEAEARANLGKLIKSLLSDLTQLMKKNNPQRQTCTGCNWQDQQQGTSLIHKKCLKCGAEKFE